MSGSVRKTKTMTVVLVVLLGAFLATPAIAFVLDKFEGESMNYGTWAQRVSDSSAGNGFALSYEGVGTATRRLTLEGSADKIAVRSRTANASTGDIYVSVCVDGACQAGKRIPPTSTGKSYAVRVWPVNVSKGDHTISVRGTDLSGVDKLLVDHVQVYGPDPGTSSGTDSDKDGVPDGSDNCAGKYNPQQADKDGDSAYGTDSSVGFDVGGDACDGLDNRHGFSPSNTAAQNENAMLALSDTSKDVVLPPGDYRYDNSDDTQVKGFKGSIRMREGARLVFTAQNRGIKFQGGTGQYLRNWTTVLPNPIRGTRSPNTVFAATTGTVVDGGSINGAVSAGMIFFTSLEPKVSNFQVSNTGRDGLNFSNSRNPRAQNITTNHTGDDAVVFYNYESGPDLAGGYAGNITVTDSYKARGIAVVGQDNVIVENFTVDRTHGPGVYVAEEDNRLYQMREPSNVIVRKGTVTRAGTIPDAGNFSGGDHSVFYVSVGPGVRFEAIRSCAPHDKHIMKAPYPGEGLNADAYEGGVTSYTGC